MSEHPWLGFNKAELKRAVSNDPMGAAYLIHDLKGKIDGAIEDIEKACDFDQWDLVSADLQDHLESLLKKLKLSNVHCVSKSGDEFEFIAEAAHDYLLTCNKKLKAPEPYMIAEIRERIDKKHNESQYHCDPEEEK